MSEAENQESFDNFIDFFLEEVDNEEESAKVISEKTETIEEIIISMVAKEPAIFDKSYTSKSNIITERYSKFNIISQAIYNVFEIYLSEDEISAYWLKICKKFAEEREKEENYIPSGSSAASSYISKWPFYKSMQFMIPHIKHRDLVSSMNYEENKGQEEQVVKTKPEKKKKAQVTNDSENIAQILQNINECIDKMIPKENRKATGATAEDYIPLIKKGFKKIDENYKFDCTADILQYLNNYLKTK